MKWMFSILPLIACTVLFASGNTPGYTDSYAGISVADTLNSKPTLASFVIPANSLYQSDYTLKQIDLVLKENRNTQFSLGLSKQGRQVPAYYIPGLSSQRALIIAGVHGSELSAIEVAYRVVSRLLEGEQPYYSVIIVPTLFPDNALKALHEPAQIGSVDNIGRYSWPQSVDPNRQMPSPGQAYDEATGLDHIGRTIEKENQFLLQLIQAFRPQRIANIHAIRDPNYGGIYADPRTDHKGLALGFASDSSLAVNMASFIHHQGGNVAGNRISQKPTALYYKDPAPARAGEWQRRNMSGSALQAKRGSGVSLGTWASTAVYDEKIPGNNRDAMRILTIEYPGCKRPGDYSKESQQLFQIKQTELYAAAIKDIFLGRHFIEETGLGFAHQ